MSAAIITRERVRGGAPLCGDDLRERAGMESRRWTGMEQESEGGSNGGSTGDGRCS